MKPVFEDSDASNAFLVSWSESCKFIHKTTRHVDFKLRTECSCIKMRRGAKEEIIALHDAVCKWIREGTFES